MDISEREILIGLTNMGLSNRDIEKILEHENSLSEFWKEAKGKLKHINYLSEEKKNKIKFDKFYINSIIEKVNSYNIGILTSLDDDYPDSLNYVDDKPNVLYYKGQLKFKDSVGIVGSRKCTSYGKWACEKFSKDLISYDYTIISGMAMGIDEIAHKTAINNKAYSIGVLGNGIDVIYPKRNRELYSIMGENHCLISEFPLGTQPLSYNFPRRNRIIAGLSKFIIVVEAELKSGSLITAHLALDQGKDVYAVPGNINSIFSRGTNKLIQDGAIPLLTINDIEDIDLKDTLKESRQLNLFDYSDDEIKLLELIKTGPKSSEDLSYSLNMNISKINILLTQMELKGDVKEISKNIFVLC